MRNRPVWINFLSALLLAAAIGLAIYWAARPMRGQAAANRLVASKPMTPTHHSALARRSFSPSMPDSARPQALQGLPLAFIENHGQADARAAFLVQGRDAAAYFTAQGLTLALTQGRDGISAKATGNTRQRWNLKLDFVGANPAALPSGQELANAQISYFSGAPEHWHTGIKSYTSIAYRNLWPGIDLVYSGTTERLKYEFVVKPGADPQQIKLAYRGTNAPLAINPQGRLEIPTPFGVIHDDKPVSAQGKGKQVKTEFAVYGQAADGSQQYGFKVGKYDRRKTLVIDPAILVYSGFLGGTGDDEGHSVAVDGNGYAYVTGVTTSAQATFPETAGPDVSYNGRTDAFVAKIKTDGSGLVYCGYIGGDGDEAGHSIAVDASGNTYVTGWTNSTQATFPVVGTLGPTFNGAIDAFVAKINPAGTALSYCGYIGGDDEDEGLGIAVDASGRAYVTGLTASTEATFPKLVGPGLLFNGAIDAFVARVKADGSGLDYAGYLGGSGDDQGRGIAVDTNNNAYVAGLTTSTESSFPMVGALGAGFKGGTDAFVAKVNSTGSAVSYSGFIGGNGIDEAYGIAVDAAGSAYITGRTTSTEATFPKLVGPKLTFNGGIDAFVAKINPAGSALSYAGYIGGDGDDEGFGIAVDSAGNTYVTGRTTSGEATFPKGNAFDLTLNSASDGFLAKVNPAGSALSYAGYLGGNGLEEGFGAAVNGLRQVYVTGRSTSDTGFPTMVGPSLSFGGSSDAFVMRIDDSSVICPALSIGPATPANGTIGAAYNQVLTGSGGTGPYSFTIISGALPPNLILSTIGVISGTPIQSGSFGFTVTTTDATGCTGTKVYTLMIGNCPAITVSPNSLPASTSFTFYNQTIAASGGTMPYNFTVSVGTLPAGLTLASSGLLSGAPTATGTFSFTVRATDNAACNGEQAYTLTITNNMGLMFYPLPRPVRLLDTRAGQGNCDSIGTPITGGTSLTTLARITCEGITIPSTAQAIVGNITVVNGSGQSGFLTLYPAGQTLPLAANMIYNPGDILSNAFTVGLNANGQFNIFGERTIDVIVDISGYYAPPAAGGLYYHSLSKPIRLLDTRAGQGNCDSVSTPITGGTSLTTLARTTCETLTIPAAAQAIVGNATVINGSGQTGYLTIYPNGVPVPLAANMVYFPGQILSNAFTVSLNASGEFNIFGERTIDMVIDVAGYYSNEANDANGPGLLYTPLLRPLRIMDTRAGQGNCDSVSTPITGGNSLAVLARLTCESITIPAAAQTVLGNVTVINQTAQAGFLTLYPDGLAQPLAANMVYFPGQLLSNAFVVGLNAGTGQFRIFAERTLDSIVDVSGYFAP